MAPINEGGGKRLVQIGNATCLERLQWDYINGGDENDLEFRTGGFQPVSQLDAGQAFKVNIEHKAIEPARWIPAEKTFG